MGFWSTTGSFLSEVYKLVTDKAEEITNIKEDYSNASDDDLKDKANSARTDLERKLAKSELKKREE